MQNVKVEQSKNNFSRYLDEIHLLLSHYHSFEQTLEKIRRVSKLLTQMITEDQETIIDQAGMMVREKDQEMEYAIYYYAAENIMQRTIEGYYLVDSVANQGQKKRQLINKYIQKDCESHRLRKYWMKALHNKILLNYASNREERLEDLEYYRELYHRVQGVKREYLPNPYVTLSVLSANEKNYDEIKIWRNKAMEHPIDEIEREILIHVMLVYYRRLKNADAIKRYESLVNKKFNINIMMLK